MRRQKQRRTPVLLAAISITVPLGGCASEQDGVDGELRTATVAAGIDPALVDVSKTLGA